MLTPWVKRLLIANVVVFLHHVAGCRVSPVSLVVPAVRTFCCRRGRSLTYMFVHGGFLHLFFNMLALFFFGPPLEEALGLARSSSSTT